MSRRCRLRATCTQRICRSVRERMGLLKGAVKEVVDARLDGSAAAEERLETLLLRGGRQQVWPASLEPQRPERGTHQCATRRC